jgi:very-short-patch-repair endonuclease
MIVNELNKSMYYNASPSTLAAARILRKNMTRCEHILWEKLKEKKIHGVRFRRQHPIDLFIADFYCHEVRLVIEVDGEFHSGTTEYDEGRTGEIEKFGIKVIRFRNDEIENNIDQVVTNIKRIVQTRLESPPSGGIRG